MKSDELDRQIKNAQQGRSEGFVWLLEEYGSRLYRYFLRFSGSTTDAEDLVQELFVRLLKTIKSYRHENKFEHWLFRIAANLARDRARKLVRHGPEISLQSDEQVFEFVQAKEKTPPEQLVEGEQRDRLQQALKQLPQLDREMILLRHYGQLSFKEIAEHFNAPLGTALAKVHRGLKQLKKSMSENETKEKQYR